MCLAVGRGTSPFCSCGRVAAAVAAIAVVAAGVQ